MEHEFTPAQVAKLKKIKGISDYDFFLYLSWGIVVHMRLKSAESEALHHEPSRVKRELRALKGKIEGLSPQARRHLRIGPNRVSPLDMILARLDAPYQGPPSRRAKEVRIFALVIFLRFGIEKVHMTKFLTVILEASGFDVDVASIIKSIKPSSWEEVAALLDTMKSKVV